MFKITFMGAGSTIFARNVIGDILCTPSLHGAEIALYDIDAERLNDSLVMLNAINQNVGGEAHITPYLGVENRKAALKEANYVVNAIQVGGYDPCTILDFEIPKKYGLRQTIADTMGVGGVFRALRTIPVMQDFAQDMREVCPAALLLNYSNPMAILTGAMIRLENLNTVGLCHSVQVCVPRLLKHLGMKEMYDNTVQWKIAGINHQAWLLEISKDGVDLYPEIKRRAQLLMESKLEAEYDDTERHSDLVRLELMKRFGYYLTESSEHNAEYNPFFIKKNYPELLDRFDIPLDDYPRRCINQINEWKQMRNSLVGDQTLGHQRSQEYASRIIEAMETNIPYKIGGNVLNKGLIDNLPSNAIVEVPCMVDKSGIQPVHIGVLPEQCAALNRTNINVQLLTIEAARTHKKDYIYQAVMLDPHCAAELSIDDIVSMCDDMLEAHGHWLPSFD